MSNKIKTEQVSKDLEKEIHNQAMKLHTAPSYEELRKFALHFVEWQKEQDKETIELAEDHAMLAGMNKMEEQMMKDAKCVKVYDDWTYGKDADKVKQPAIKLRDQSLQIGSEVKLIIIRESKIC